jgi:hypothetical protein
MLAQDLVDQPEHLRSGAHRAGRVEADLQVRSGRDPDDPIADLADLLTGLDVLTDVDEVRAGVAVVDLESGQRARGDLEDRRVGPEAVDPLADDHAAAHRVLRRATRCRVVDALVDVAIDDVLTRQRERHAVADHVRDRL